MAELTRAALRTAGSMPGGGTPRGSRRAFISGVGAATLALTTGCRTGANTPAASGSAAWTYADSRGIDVALEGPPKVLVADTYSAASLWDFGVHVDGVFGWGLEEGSAWANTLGNLDLSKVETVGKAGELDLEAIDALGPDLIIGNQGYNVDYAKEPDAKPLEWVSDEVIDELVQIAPPLATAWFEISLIEAMDNYEKLAAALGADVESDPLTEAKASFAEAEQRLDELGGRTPLSLVTMLAETDAVWVANPKGFAGLEYLAERGFESVVPDDPNPWEELSWEQVGTYPADVILFLGENPLESGVFDDRLLWTRLPAVEAGQVLSFNDKWPFSYVFYAEALHGLADAFETFDVVT